ncbi:hypothetical protein KAU33_08845 [Candidatus Dependentiae bacterium]|nr:hypothetical protein [Candidatus Dependentiae bacterium]
MKIVTNATVKVVKLNDLRVGDNILWGNWKRKVVQINIKERIVSVDGPYGDQIENPRPYANYYVIESCEEIDVFAD